MIKRTIKENRIYILVGFLLSLSCVIGIPLYVYDSLVVLYYNTTMTLLTITILVMYTITFAVLLSLIFNKKNKKNK